MQVLLIIGPILTAIGIFMFYYVNTNNKSIKKDVKLKPTNIPIEDALIKAVETKHVQNKVNQQKQQDIEAVVGGFIKQIEDGHLNISEKELLEILRNTLPRDEISNEILFNMQNKNHAFIDSTENYNKRVSIEYKKKRNEFLNFRYLGASYEEIPPEPNWPSREYSKY